MYPSPVGQRVQGLPRIDGEVDQSGHCVGRQSSVSRETLLRRETPPPSRRLCRRRVTSQLPLTRMSALSLERQQSCRLGRSWRGGRCPTAQKNALDLRNHRGGPVASGITSIESKGILSVLTIMSSRDSAEDLQFRERGKTRGLLEIRPQNQPLGTPQRQVSKGAQQRVVHPSRVAPCLPRTSPLWTRCVPRGVPEIHTEFTPAARRSGCR
jgi:hypothetical protein